MRGKHFLLTGQCMNIKILTCHATKQSTNKTVGRFVVRNLENHLNYIDFFLVQIIMIQNLFRDNYKVKSLN